jgi:hypothetical protein
MNISLSSINWFAIIPLGIISLFFLWLGFRRGIRFFDHESNSSQKERLRDIFLFTFNLVAIAFCVLIAMSPTELWLVMIPIGLGLFIFVIPVSLLGSYYELYVVTGYMPKNAGFHVQLNDPNEKLDGKIVWYEFSPFIFIAGWFIYFIVSIVKLILR